MASVITRSAHPDALWPGVLKWFGLNYEEFPDIWEESFDRIEGELATERLIEATGFGLAQTKTESAPITVRQRLGRLCHSGDAQRRRPGLSGDARRAGGQPLHGSQPASR